MAGIPFQPSAGNQTTGENTGTIISSPTGVGGIGGSFMTPWGGYTTPLPTVGGSGFNSGGTLVGGSGFNSGGTSANPYIGGGGNSGGGSSHIIQSTPTNQAQVQAEFASSGTSQTQQFLNSQAANSTGGQYVTPAESAAILGNSTGIGGNYNASQFQANQTNFSSQAASAVGYSPFVSSAGSQVVSNYTLNSDGSVTENGITYSGKSIIPGTGKTANQIQQEGFKEARSQGINQMGNYSIKYTQISQPHPNNFSVSLTPSAILNSSQLANEYKPQQYYLPGTNNPTAKWLGSELSIVFTAIQNELPIKSPVQFNETAGTVSYGFGVSNPFTGKTLGKYWSADQVSNAVESVGQSLGGAGWSLGGTVPKAAPIGKFVGGEVGTFVGDFVPKTPLQATVVGGLGILSGGSLGFTGKEIGQGIISAVGTGEAINPSASISQRIAGGVNAVAGLYGFNSEIGSEAMRIDLNSLKESSPTYEFYVKGGTSERPIISGIARRNAGDLQQNTAVLFNVEDIGNKEFQISGGKAITNLLQGETRVKGFSLTPEVTEIGVQKFTFSGEAQDVTEAANFDIGGFLKSVKSPETVTFAKIEALRFPLGENDALLKSASVSVAKPYADFPELYEFVGAKVPKEYLSKIGEDVFIENIEKGQIIVTPSYGNPFLKVPFSDFKTLGVIKDLTKATEEEGFSSGATYFVKPSNVASSVAINVENELSEASINSALGKLGSNTLKAVPIFPFLNQNLPSVVGIYKEDYFKAPQTYSRPQTILSYKNKQTFSPSFSFNIERVSGNAISKNLIQRPIQGSILQQGNLQRVINIQIQGSESVLKNVSRTKNVQVNQQATPDFIPQFDFDFNQKMRYYQGINGAFHQGKGSSQRRTGKSNSYIYAPDFSSKIFGFRLPKGTTDLQIKRLAQNPFSGLGSRPQLPLNFPIVSARRSRR